MVCFPPWVFSPLCFSLTIGNGQVSLIFGVPNFCVFSPPLVPKIDEGRGAEKRKN